MTPGRPIYLILFLLAAVLAACSDKESTQPDPHDHSDNQQRITYWQGDIEIFALYEIHSNSQRVDGKLFISKSHQPLELEHGVISILQNATAFDQNELSDEGKGIYPFELSYDSIDEAVLNLTFQAAGGDYEFTFDSFSDSITEDSHGDSDDRVVLDKAMQWHLGVSSDITEYQTIPHVITGTGSTVRNPRYYHEVRSPVDGYISPESFHINPVSGAEVTPGMRLMAISPSLVSQNSWVEIKLSYNQARQAYERARNLLDNDAISLREYQEREREYEVRKAGYEQFINNSGAAIKLEDGGRQLYLNSAKQGVINDSYIEAGREIRQGDLLFTIFDPSRLWVDVVVYKDELQNLREITGVELLTSRNGSFTYSPPQAEVVSRDPRSDVTGSRTSLTLSVDNRDRALSMNQPVRVRLAGDDAHDVIAVPNEAIFDNEAYKAVFVMHSGDQFERRVVKTGSSYGGWTAITEGLESGERVATGRIYPLHLMTGNVQIDDDHDH